MTVVDGRFSGIVCILDSNCLYDMVDEDPVGVMVICSTMNVVSSEYIDRGVACCDAGECVRC